MITSSSLSVQSYLTIVMIIVIQNRLPVQSIINEIDTSNLYRGENMFYAYKLIGSLIVPPGLLCAVMALLAFVLFRKKGGKIIASAILLLSLSIYFISISVGANIITGPLEEKHQNSLPKTESPVAFLVLAGGSSYDGEGRASNPSVYSLERIYTAVRTAEFQKFFAPERSRTVATVAGSHFDLRFVDEFHGMGPGNRLDGSGIVEG